MGKEEDAAFPLPERFDFEASAEAIERDLAVSRWIRDWQWSQQFAPPGPPCVVTGI